MKNQLNIRVSEVTAVYIESLAEWTGETKTGVVTTAVNRYYEEIRMKRSDMKALLESVSRALTSLEEDGIEGWGLNNCDESLFSLVATGAAGGCTSETCSHNSHDPAAPNYKLTPISGKLYLLGHEREADEVSIMYYALIDGGNVKYYELRQPRNYWASVRETGEKDVPEWALAELAKA